VRAYDEDTGKVLWTGTFAGNAPGVPVSYESKGRQFVALISSQPQSAGNTNTAATPAAATPPANAPYGLVAYALPKK